MPPLTSSRRSAQYSAASSTGSPGLLSCPKEIVISVAVPLDLSVAAVSVPFVAFSDSVVPPHPTKDTAHTIAKIVAINFFFIVVSFILNIIYIHLIYQLAGQIYQA